MPGLLPHIKVGAESELGRAVSQLTGLSSLLDLAEHVRRAKTKIDKEFVKGNASDREKADRDYALAKADLKKILETHPEIAPPKVAPEPYGDKGIDPILREIETHFERTKAEAFRSAQEILGDAFDPTNPAILRDLEKNIARALERVAHIGFRGDGGSFGGILEMRNIAFMKRL